ncbi:hypothetical protein JCM8097_001803 [Rhodosporidiobolus ruineniae]
MAPTGLSAVFPGRFVVVLDGGMGTTLQAPPFDLGLDSALWSSELLADEAGREQLKRLHQAWIDAGADIVETCTYQSSLPLFLPSSPPYSATTLSSAKSTMLSALPLATSCCHDAASSASSSAGSKPVTALSLGPYGSSLQPGQEYGGHYPSPFSPSGADAAYPQPLSQPAAASSALQAVPLPLDAVRLPNQPEDETHLAAWHLQRLTDFAASEAFGAVPLLAFETIPVLAEARAIRRAVAALASSSAPAKPFWLSFVFPATSSGDGVAFPDPSPSFFSLASAPLSAQCAAIVEAAFTPFEGHATPAAIGLNCTSPIHAAEVVQALTEARVAFASTASEQKDGGEDTKPWLVLYPDGGAQYDVVTRTWSNPLGLTDNKWAVLVADAAGVARASGAWGGVVVGGCCKAGPGAIRALREEVERRGWAGR